MKSASGIPPLHDGTANNKKVLLMREPGFTLSELMIVIGILSILTGILGLSYLSMRPRLVLNGATRQIQGDLMSARMKAVNEINDYKFLFTSDHEYTILDDDDNDGTIDADEWSHPKDIQDDYVGVTFITTGDPVFSAKGTADNLVTITLSNSDGDTKSISIAITGRVKIN